MKLLLELLFALNFSLILLHEMDAIRQKEWKMFIFLKDMKEDVAYWIFTVIHLPLYFAVIVLLLSGDGKYQMTLSIGLDIFIVFHTIIHYVFKNKINNGFNNIFSNLIINTGCIISLLHISIYFKLIVK
ncbi:DUF6713 family protein [Clostridium brassicae]|uniref:DUF3307 domain-containing protein n=1 Tax=Clostridium brassicae TaxID=2999072 RepID=A0ABT4DD57_9CLOT|nr:DUF6713 family protein [Clostridium brassicae]MCY6960251.1 hypothetical protein [Clostridium brassicae]